MTNIYEEAVRSMNPEDIANWQTDLYLKVTPESRRLVEKYDYKNLVETFVDNIDHELWYDIPFAYTPEWEGRGR